MLLISSDLFSNEFTKLSSPPLTQLGKQGVEKKEVSGHDITIFVYTVNFSLFLNSDNFA